VLVQEINPSVSGKPKNKAMHFVLGMGGAVLGVCLFCGLIWWFTTGHSFDTLGRMVMLSGGILIAIGFYSVMEMTSISKRMGGFVHSEQSRQRRQKMREDGSYTDLQVRLFFLGSGLICLFTGFLIYIGL